MRKLAVLAITLGLGYTVMSYPQSRDFEVASIKPTRLQGAGVRNACHGIDSVFAPKDLAATVPLGRCLISSGRLSHMIGVAYDVTMDMLKGGPDWVASGNDRYDVEAKAEDPSTAIEADLQMMLQRLLADRFKLKFHRETQELDGFELVVAKNGPKIRQAGPNEEERIALGVDGNQDVAVAKKAAAEGDKNPAQPSSMMLSVQKVSMARLAQLLQLFARGGHIRDATNLKGFYDAKLVVETGQDVNGPLQEQLGLKLEARKIAVEMLVVDSAEKPAAN
ncbi:MAG TPA: TIGR03435 family protein [Terriglobia bacterium]